MIKKYHDTCGEWDEWYIFWSRDSNIRAAKIKVGKAGTIINRPVKKLYSLECSMTMINLGIWEVLRDLVPFVQFKKRQKHQWSSGTFSKVADFSLQLY